MENQEIKAGVEIIKQPNGDTEYYLNGKLHRVNGPAAEFSTGDKEWYQNGKRHCENGPAVERPNGDKFWYLNGKLSSH